ncbi:hypothetical protein RvY_17537 [Ramazzottius varieornatus]|uniref:Uncharacterized protein n=1 Tax=Ramazzottius varieornatus TaxID=947166 RepID=A0A1D1W2G0_RAMVA|nr:hypothetical protein RvY_17537 [Ramazzottius varieornatus]
MARLCDKPKTRTRNFRSTLDNSFLAVVVVDYITSHSVVEESRYFAVTHELWLRVLVGNHCQGSKTRNREKFSQREDEEQGSKVSKAPYPKGQQLQEEQSKTLTGTKTDQEET